VSNFGTIIVYPDRILAVSFIPRR